MSQATTRTGLTWNQYLDWEQQQSNKHEFVDGQVRAITGGTVDHDTICNNLRLELATQLRGNERRFQGSDLKVQTGRNARYPDALIDCGPLVRGALFAQKPVTVFEVLSKSTAWIDQSLKLRDYEATPSILSYVLISQDEPRVLVYRRDEAGRFAAATAVLLEGLSETITLADPPITLPLASLYDGLEINLPAV